MAVEMPAILSEDCRRQSNYDGRPLRSVCQHLPAISREHPVLPTPAVRSSRSAERIGADPDSVVSTGGASAHFPPSTDSESLAAAGRAQHARTREGAAVDRSHRNGSRLFGAKGHFGFSLAAPGLAHSPTRISSKASAIALGGQMSCPLLRRSVQPCL